MKLAGRVFKSFLLPFLCLTLALSMLGERPKNYEQLCELASGLTLEIKDVEIDVY